MNKMENVIKEKITGRLSPTLLEVVDESDKHNVPAGSESHFKLLVVSSGFAEHSLIDRHRLIYSLLAQELAGQIHALSIQALTPEEWEQGGKVGRTTPPCLGGSAAKR